MNKCMCYGVVKMSDSTRLSKQERNARNKYMREYRKANKEKIQAINKRYWAKVVERNKEIKEAATSKAEE